MKEKENPYGIFNEKVNAKFDGKYLKDLLNQYEKEFTNLYELYREYFDKLKGVYIKNSGVRIGKDKTEDLLANRYTQGLSLNNTYLNKEEINRLLTIDDKELNSMCVPDEIIDIFLNSANMIYNYKQQIQEAIKNYDKNKNAPKAINEILDIILVIERDKKIAKVAEEIANDLDTQGESKSKEAFKIKLKSSPQYKKIKKFDSIIITDRKNNFAKANMQVPNVNISNEKKLPTTEPVQSSYISKPYYEKTIDEILSNIPNDMKPRMLKSMQKSYVQSNMCNSREVGSIKDETIEIILLRERDYFLKFFNNVRDHSFVNKKSKDSPMENEKHIDYPMENQNHDYNWDITLSRPQKIIDNELVNTKAFQGRITVEKLGTFTSHAEFCEKEKSRKTLCFDSKERKSKLYIGSRKKLNYETEFYVEYEPKVKLSNNILKVTKTNSQGQQTKDIIFTEVDENYMKDPKLAEFIKNIYLSEYILDVAKHNGGYAGKIKKSDKGYYISNIDNITEIASAILFQNNQFGDIFDERDTKNPKKYEYVQKEKFLKLLEEGTLERKFYE